ncbi:MAG: hypothetical protein ACOZBW_01020, partial [Thermodesulfobacteriota bacterium]
DTSKTVELRALNTLLSSRVKQVAEDVSEIQERFAWLHQSFYDLVKTESRKNIRDCMAPVHVVLKEDDTINWAIYSMFKLQVRELLVTHNGKVVGVLNFTHLFTELMSIVGPDCDAILKSVYAS